MNDDKVDDNKSVELNNDKKKIKTTHTTDIPEKKVGLVTFENVPVRYTWWIWINAHADSKYEVISEHGSGSVLKDSWSILSLVVKW